jgi:hypothetical protein
MIVAMLQNTKHRKWDGMRDDAMMRFGYCSKD